MTSKPKSNYKQHEFEVVGFHVICKWCGASKYGFRKRKECIPSRRLIQ
uniref:ORF10 n=1 Tax=Nitrosopumilaceae spindle-shaped virus TaxID=3065433 RepID=A0AAT9JAK2_9VIRU